MVVNDPIADMLTRIRNAQIAKHDSVTMPASNMKKSIAKLLHEEGYIKSYEFIDDGLQGRTIVSGIARYYEPEELVGKQLCFIANLPPRTLRGIVSQGMILSAMDKEGNLRLVSIEEGVADGAIIG